MTATETTTSPKKFFHYCGERISKRKAIKLLENE